VSQTTPALQLRSFKSADGGATWAFDATVSSAQTAADKELMWVDHRPTSPFKDNIYVIWHNNLPVFVARRTAAGWQPPLRVSGAETTGTGIGGDIKTNSDGDVFAFWPDTGSRTLLVAKSTDGGASFAQPVTITTTYGAFTIGVPSFASRKALIYPSGGAFRTAAKNLVYAAWADLSGESGCTTPGDAPGTNVDSACKTRIWFSRSTDGGATWEVPRMINNQRSLNDQFNPRLAVDETTGRLVVVYYDTVGDSGRLKTDVWTQSSSDDGVTWSAPVKVTTAETDETAAGADSGNQYGDYIGLSGYAGIFFPSWTDRRSGGPEEIWTAPIRFPLDKVVQLWGNGNQLAMKVYGSDGSSGYKLIWKNDNMGQGAGAIAWLVGDLDGDGKAKIVQLWNDHNHLAMFFYGSDGSGGYKLTSDLYTQEVPRAVAWLVGDLDGDGKAKIVQLWDKGNRLAMNVYGSDGSGGYKRTWQSSDMGQGPGAVAWLVGDLDGDGKAKIIQLWNDHNNLQMVFYGSDGSGGYTQTFALNTGQGPGAVAWLAPWSWR
jgi:hypothetical protein